MTDLKQYKCDEMDLAALKEWSKLIQQRIEEINQEIWDASKSRRVAKPLTHEQTVMWRALKQTPYSEFSRIVEEMECMPATKWSATTKVEKFVQLCERHGWRPYEYYEAKGKK